MDSIFTGALNREVAKRGTHAISPGTLSAGSNYNDRLHRQLPEHHAGFVSCAGGRVQSKVYGSVDLTLTYTHTTHRANGDTEAVFTGNLIRDPETVADSPYVLLIRERLGWQ